MFQQFLVVRKTHWSSEFVTEVSYVTVKYLRETNILHSLLTPFIEFLWNTLYLVMEFMLHLIMTYILHLFMK